MGVENGEGRGGEEGKREGDGEREGHGYVGGMAEPMERAEKTASNGESGWAETKGREQAGMALSQSLSRSSQRHPNTSMFPRAAHVVRCRNAAKSTHSRFA